MEIYIGGNREGYTTKQCPRTMTVGELIDWLEQYNDDVKVYLKYDNGFTFGALREDCLQLRGEDYADIVRNTKNAE